MAPPPPSPADLARLERSALSVLEAIDAALAVCGSWLSVDAVIGDHYPRPMNHATAELVARELDTHRARMRADVRALVGALERAGFLDRGSREYRVGDVFERLAEIPDGSIDMIVTSPPFLALRSYLPADHPDKHREIGSACS